MIEQLTQEVERTKEQTQQHLQRITLLREINLATTSTLDLSTLLNILLEKIDRLLPYQAATTVRLCNKQNGELEPLACRNLDEKEWRARRERDQHRLAKLVVETKTPLAIDDLQADPRRWDPEFCRKYGLVSYLGVPLVAKGEVLGVLSFYTREAHQFTAEEVEFLATLAGQAAMAIYNAQLFEQLKASKEELEKANRIKSHFLGMMSHELRTPLSVIIGNIAILKEKHLGEINSEQETRLAIVERNAADLFRMLQGILDITRLEEGKMPVHFEEFTVEGLLDEIRTDFAELAQKKGVRLEIHGNGVMRPMLSDRMKLKEILDNLVSNAMKFTKKGRVEVKMRYHNADDRIEFVVQDTGIGMRGEDLQHIFDIFYQVDSSDQRRFGGAGLGLNIVKRLVDLLQGEIRVESEPGKGSTFTVVVPRKISVSHHTFFKAGCQQPFETN